MTIVPTGGKTKTKITPVVIWIPTALGLPLVNTMGKKMTPTAIMKSALTPTRVAIPTIVERRNPLNFFCAKLLLDKCGNLWYNKGGVQRALGEGQGPNSGLKPPYGIFLLNLAHMAQSRSIP